MPLNFAANTSDKFVYFINSHSVTIADTKFSEEHYSIFKYYIESGFKEKIYDTTDRLEYLTLSSEGQYLAFTRYDSEQDYEDSYHKEILNLADVSSQNVGLGLNATWANTTNKLFTGTDQRLYITDTQSPNHQQSLPASLTVQINTTDSFEFAAWSPDDTYLIFNILSGNTHLFQTTTKKVITLNSSLGNYHWLNGNKFLAVKDNELYKFSVSDLDHPETLDINVLSHTYMDVSPDKKRIAHIKPDEGLYVSALDGASSQLLVEQDSHIDPGFPKWLTNDLLLFHNRSGNLYLYNLAENKLTQI